MKTGWQNCIFNVIIGHFQSKILYALKSLLKNHNEIMRVYYQAFLTEVNLNQNKSFQIRNLNCKNEWTKTFMNMWVYLSKHENMYQ